MAKKNDGEVINIGGNTIEKPRDGMVTIQLFRDNDKYVDDVFVAVNGKGYQIQRGVPVTVPDYVAEVLQRSVVQDNNTAMLISRLQDEYIEASKKI